MQTFWIQRLIFPATRRQANCPADYYLGADYLHHLQTPATGPDRGEVGHGPAAGAGRPPPRPTEAASYRSGWPPVARTRTVTLSAVSRTADRCIPRRSPTTSVGTRRLELPKIRLPDLRHTHATLALRAGVHPRVVQERLGHANVSITLDTYSHVDLDMQAIAAARVAALVIGDLE